MATSAVIKLTDTAGNCVCQIYKHWDGYPEGLGQDLKNFINSEKLVNDIPTDSVNIKLFSGFSDFIAQLIWKLKDSGELGKPIKGDVYIYSPEDELSFVEYIYEINSKLELSCFDYNGRHISI